MAQVRLGEAVEDPQDVFALAVEGVLEHIEFCVHAGLPPVLSSQLR